MEALQEVGWPALLAGGAVPAFVLWLALERWLYRHLDKALLGLIALAPFHTLVRGLNADSVLLSGWRDGLYLAVLAVWAGGTLRRRFRVPAAPAILAVLLLNLAGLLQILQAETPLAWAAGFRDIIKYSLLAVVAYSVSRERPDFLRRLVKTLVAVGVLVVVLQFIFYYLDLDYVLRLGAQPPTRRGIGAFEFRRMEAFFGGAPSNLGLYLGVPLVMVVALLQGGQRLPRAWIAGALLLMVGLFMTLSFSAVLSVAFVSLLLFLGARRRSLLIVALVAAAVWIFSGLAAGFDRAELHGQEAESFATYVTNIFYRALFLRNWEILTQDGRTFLVGRGLALVGSKSFIEADAAEGVMIVGSSDGGWVEFAVQVGAPLALCVLAAVLLTLWRAVRSARGLPPLWRATVRALAAGQLVMLSSIHIIPWTRVGPDVNFWIVLGALACAPDLAAALRRDSGRVPSDWSYGRRRMQGGHAHSP